MVSEQLVCCVTRPEKRGRVPICPIAGEGIFASRSSARGSKRRDIFARVLGPGCTSPKIGSSPKALQRVGICMPKVRAVLIGRITFLHGQMRSRNLRDFCAPIFCTLWLSKHVCQPHHPKMPGGGRERHATPKTVTSPISQQEPKVLFPIWLDYKGKQQFFIFSFHS